jgi:hypothetical protein
VIPVDATGTVQVQPCILINQTNRFGGFFTPKGNQMADEVDIATEQTEVMMRSILSKRQHEPVVHPTGECNYCGKELFIEKQKYCDHKCAKNHHLQLRREGVI